MGYPMSFHLIKKFQSIKGFDLSLKNKKDFESHGGVWLKDLSSVKADIVFSMLPGGRQIKELYLEKQKLLSILKPGALIIDCSTSDPQSVIEVHQEAKKRGLKFLSAPVSGGTKGAKEGTLTFIAGGSREAFEQAKPYLQIMGKNIFHAGGASAGQSVKICNNMLLAVHMIGTCEAFALGESLGLKPEVLNEIMQKSSGQNWSLEKYNPCPGLMDQAPSSKGYQPGFSVRLMLKDLQLAKDCMDQAHQNLALGRRAFELYKEHFEEGFADKDFSHIFKKINS